MGRGLCALGEVELWKIADDWDPVSRFGVFCIYGSLIYVLRVCLVELLGFCQEPSWGPLTPERRFGLWLSFLVLPVELLRWKILVIDFREKNPIKYVEYCNRLDWGSRTFWQLNALQRGMIIAGLSGFSPCLPCTVSFQAEYLLCNSFLVQYFTACLFLV